MRNPIRFCANIAVISAVIGIAITATHGIAETRHASTHVHGTGQLNFAIDGQQIQLELTAPGFDILGFESLNTENQKRQLQTALKQLKTSPLWSFPTNAGCTLVKADSQVAGDHDGHDHLDISATYVYQCQHMDKLNVLTTSYFKQFANAAKLSVQGITTNNQISATLTRQKPEAKF